MARTATVETTAAPAARSRTVAWLAAVPAWAWVAVLVGTSAVVRFALIANHPAPWIFGDELLYGELAKSFANTGHFALREVSGTSGFGVVYPVLLSPTYALFGDVTKAYTVMKAINAVLMSLAAVPTYLLARRLVNHWLALVGALLAVALPALAYTGTIMTENAFYPAFVCWCWLTVRALERPTIWRQLAAIAVIGLAYFTRPQAVVLVPALITTLVLVIGLDAWSERGRGLGRALVDSVRRYLVTAVALAAVVVAYALYEIARGRSFKASVLGSYSVLSDQTYTISGVGRWFVYHVGELDLSVAVIPFAAFLLIVFAGLGPRERARELRIFAALAASASFWLLLEVSAFASTPYGQRIQERNLFYLDPLFMVALVACVGRGTLWSRRTAAGVAAVLAAAAPGAVPFTSFVGSRAVTDALGLLPLMSVLDRHVVAAGELDGLVVAGAAVAGALFLIVPRRLGLLLPAAVLLALSLANGPVDRRTKLASFDSREGGVLAKRNWIDRAVGTAPDVAALWSGNAAYVTLWDNEFFNRSVGPVYNFAGPPDGLPQKTVTLDQTSGRISFGGRPVRAKYVLADRTEVVAGEPVATDRGIGMTVYRTDGPLGLDAQITGVYPDHWSGPTVIYRRFHCTGGRLTVTLLSDRDLHPTPLTIVAKSDSTELGRFVYRPGLATRKMTVPLKPAGGVCTATYEIPTAVPQLVTQQPDTRPLGVRFLRFDYRSPG